VIGTVGLLLAAKDRGFLATIKPELDRLLAVRFFMGLRSGYRPGWRVMLLLEPAFTRSDRTGAPSGWPYT
jgi:hypothetical protein